MEILRFRTYDDYLAAQRRTRRRRSRHAFFTDLGMDRCASWLRANVPNIRRGICHGARDGREAHELSRRLGCEVLATDLFPAPGPVPVIQHDFQRPLPDSLGQFDFVYSNSLDHSNSPRQTLGLWLSQVHQEGAVLMQWTRADMKARDGDCFACTLYELVCLANGVGRVRDLLYVNVDPGPKRRRATESVVLCVRRA